jgi:hypothetical protein
MVALLAIAVIPALMYRAVNASRAFQLRGRPQQPPTLSPQEMDDAIIQLQWHHLQRIDPLPRFVDPPMPTLPLEFDDLRHGLPGR